MNSQITIGDVQITAVSDAVLDHPLTLDLLFPSVPEDAWEPWRRRYPAAFGGPGRWHVNVGCYLLRSQGRTILVDTGIGAAGGEIAASLNVPEGGRLLEKLRSLDVSPEDVNVVLLTHLHRDHVGWNVRRDGGRWCPTFPRARYVVQQADWEAFHRPEVQAAFSLTYVEQAVSPLHNVAGLDLVTGDVSITDEVTAVHTPGHTPGRVSVVIASRDRAAVITGDVIVHPVQVAEPDCAFRFDMDVDAARRMRYRLLERIEVEGMTVVGGHFPAPGFGRVARDDGRRRWQVV